MDIKWEEMYDELSQVEGVYNVRNLHIWEILSGVRALSAHADCDCVESESMERALKELEQVCLRNNIVHSTFQLKAMKVKCVGLAVGNCETGPRLTSILSKAMIT